MTQQKSGIALQGENPRDQVELEEHATNLELQPQSSNSVRAAKPYSVFTKGEKWIIVSIAATAGFFRYVI